MSSALWTPSSGMTAIQYSGHLEFRDISIPVPSKDEWGVDVLERRMQGPGHLYAAFEANLKQGNVFTFGGVPFYLQIWKPIDHQVFPGFMLTYKGFRNGIPDPLPDTTRTELCSSISASNLHVTYHVGSRVGVIVEATQEIKYIAPATVWRYLKNTEPEGPIFNTVRGANGVQVVDSRITITINFDDGLSPNSISRVLVGTAPAGVVSALSVSPGPFVIGPKFNPIRGTPYFECEEVVQIKYP